MEAIQIIGLISGCLAVFFALVAGIIYFKLNKILISLTEEQLKKIIDSVDKQRRRMYAYVLISSIFTILTIVLSFIYNI